MGMALKVGDKVIIQNLVEHVVLNGITTSIVRIVADEAGQPMYNLAIKDDWIFSSRFLKLVPDVDDSSSNATVDFADFESMVQARYEEHAAKLKEHGKRLDRHDSQFKEQGARLDH